MDVKQQLPSASALPHHDTPRSSHDRSVSPASLPHTVTTPSQPISTVGRFKLLARRHAAFIGPGIVASVAYADPGNWQTDLQAGSEFGYALLFAVLLSGLFAILLQVLVSRLGIVTKRDLASATRTLVLGPQGGKWQRGETQKGRAKRYARIGALWFLYVISEGAIVATELAELIGSAMALQMLFPAIPLWAGVVITSLDVFLILFVYRPGGGVRAFEILIGVLVNPDWADVFLGYVPSATLVQSRPLYISIGILGATVMPHAFYLGSHFATIDRLDVGQKEEIQCEDETAASTSRTPASGQSDGLLSPVRRYIARTFPSLDLAALDSTPHPNPRFQTVKHAARTLGFLSGPRVPSLDSASRPGEEDAPVINLASIRTHLPHVSWDIALSLLFFAITINSAILIVASAAFHNPEGGSEATIADLFDAHALLRSQLGSVSATLFAIALLAAGQSASITVTLAGQIISEGFIKWRTRPFVRRCVTRLVAIIPSLAVAVAVGRDGLDEMLVASQVALAMALPFVVFPLLLLTGNPKRMRVWEPRNSTLTDDTDAVVNSTTTQDGPALSTPAATQEVTESDGAFVHFHTAWYMQIVAWAVFTVIVLADGFVLVTLFIGEE